MCTDLPQPQESQFTAPPLPHSLFSQFSGARTSKGQARTLLSPSLHSQSSGHGRDVPPSQPEGPEDVKGTNPCFPLASFQAGEKQQNGESLHGLHPTGGMVSLGKTTAAPSLCEHKGLNQRKGESPALPHVLGQWGPKKCSHFPPIASMPCPVLSPGIRSRRECRCGEQVRKCNGRGEDRDPCG